MKEEEWGKGCGQASLQQGCTHRGLGRAASREMGNEVVSRNLSTHPPWSWCPRGGLSWVIRPAWLQPLMASP